MSAVPKSDHCLEDMSQTPCYHANSATNPANTPAAPNTSSDPTLNCALAVFESAALVVAAALAPLLDRLVELVTKPAVFEEDRENDAFVVLCELVTVPVRTVTLLAAAGALEDGATVVVAPVVAACVDAADPAVAMLTNVICPLLAVETWLEPAPSMILFNVPTVLPSPLADIWKPVP